MIKSIAKVLASNALLTIVGLINSFFFPIILNIDEYACYQEYILYISYVNICHLGVASGMFLNYVGQNYEKIDKKQYKSEILLIFSVLGLFTFVGMLICGIARSYIVLCVVLTIFPQGIIASFQALYQAWERFTGYSIINAMPKLLFTIFTMLTYFIAKKISGNYVITTYLIIQWIVTLYFFVEFMHFTSNVKGNSIVSTKNMQTTYNGFLITIGNYVNLLFHAIDKQFVHVFYSTFAFAQYSFAMSAQNIMTIFITALANPFYPRLAKENFDKEFIKRIKELLLIFGAYSGCAYFGVSFFVKIFVSKYQESLKVVSIFFAVFPAMAVINVLYINLYRIRKLLKKYIFTLIGILFTTIILSYLFIIFKGNYVDIAFATMISYYLWFLYSQIDFDEINISRKDIIYLIGYFLIYFILIEIKNEVLGFLIYTLLISLWNFIVYRSTVKYVFAKVHEKLFYGGM